MVSLQNANFTFQNIKTNIKLKELNPTELGILQPTLVHSNPRLDKKGACSEVQICGQHRLVNREAR